MENTELGMSLKLIKEAIEMARPKLPIKAKLSFELDDMPPDEVIAFADQVKATLNKADESLRYFWFNTQLDGCKLTIRSKRVDVSLTWKDLTPVIEPCGKVNA